jgi:porphobilinogen deaminase
MSRRPAILTPSYSRGYSAFVPLAWGRVHDGLLRLTGRVISPDGTEPLAAAAEGMPEDALAVDARVADELAAQGADDLIRRSQDST